MRLRLPLLLLAVATLFAKNLCGQELSQSAKRYEIDVKRLGLNPTDKEALFRSREFIRIDPSYYVGYYYEAIFKYDRASDYLGYKNAVPALKKAISLLEKDFSEKLSKQYASREEYFPLDVIRTDYTVLINTLVTCYNNLEHPDSTMLWLKRYQQWNFQRDMLGSNNDIAWAYHRNRFHTSEKYAFLKNSVE